MQPHRLAAGTHAIPATDTDRDDALAPAAGSPVLLNRPPEPGEVLYIDTADTDDDAWF